MSALHDRRLGLPQFCGSSRAQQTPLHQRTHSLARPTMVLARGFVESGLGLGAKAWGQAFSSPDTFSSPLDSYRKRLNCVTFSSECGPEM